MVSTSSGLGGYWRPVVAVLVALVVTMGTAPAAPGLADTVEPLTFREVGDEAGFQHSVTTGQSAQRGGAVYVLDYNNDGWPDVLTLGGDVPVLFENTGGEFERSDALPYEAFDDHLLLSALAFDYDNDGWTDLVLVPFDGDPLLLENVDGRFERRETALSASPDADTFSLSTADYDGDGCLDVFMLQNGDWSEEAPAGESSPNRSVTDDNGNRNVLFKGNCRGGFENVTAGTGLEGARWSLATSFVDLTADGRPDIHVANDYNNDYLYVNLGDGSFAAQRLGSATDRNGMASDVADLTGDGRLDLFVTNIHFDVGRIENPLVQAYFRSDFGRRLGGNNLLVNRGDGRFVDEGGVRGLAEGGWGWAASTTDFDNDGDQDVVHTTKRFRPSFWSGSPEQHPNPAVFEATGNGTFDKRNASALGFEAHSGLGVAHLDYDRDGDQDLVVGVLRGEFRLYENVGTSENWLQVDLEAGDKPALGARVYVTTDAGTQLRVHSARTDYLSQDSRVLHFGLDDATAVERVRIVWPDDSERVVDDVSPNQRLTVVRDANR